MSDRPDWAALGDDDLQATLAGALGADPPAGARDAALAAFDFVDLDGALAALVADSRSGELAGIRAATVADEITLDFATDELDVAVEVRGRRAVGQVTPAGPTAGRVEAPGMRTTLFAVDRLGRFETDLPVGRPVRLVVQGPGGVVRTDWFRI